MQVHKDQLMVDVYHSTTPQPIQTNEQRLRCAHGAAVCALCLHWLSKVQFAPRDKYEGALIQTALTCAEAAGLSDTHAMKMNAQVQAFQHAFEQDSLQAAVTAGMRYCDMCKAAKGDDVSPHVGVQLRSIVQIAMLAQQWQAVVKAGDLALKHLQVSHEGTQVLLDTQQHMQMAAEMLRMG